MEPFSGRAASPCTGGWLPTGPDVWESLYFLHLNSQKVLKKSHANHSRGTGRCNPFMKGGNQRSSTLELSAPTKKPEKRFDRVGLFRSMYKKKKKKNIPAEIKNLKKEYLQ